MEKFMPENEKYPLVSVVMAVYNNMDEKKYMIVWIDTISDTQTISNVLIIQMFT